MTPKQKMIKRILEIIDDSGECLTIGPVKEIAALVDEKRQLTIDEIALLYAQFTQEERAECTERLREAGLLDSKLQLTNDGHEWVARLK